MDDDERPVKIIQSRTMYGAKGSFHLREIGGDGTTTPTTDPKVAFGDLPNKAIAVKVHCSDLHPSIEKSYSKVLATPGMTVKQLIQKVLYRLSSSIVDLNDDKVLTIGNRGLDSISLVREIRDSSGVVTREESVDESESVLEEARKRGTDFRLKFKPFRRAGAARRRLIDRRKEISASAVQFSDAKYSLRRLTKRLSDSDDSPSSSPSLLSRLKLRFRFVARSPPPPQSASPSRQVGRSQFHLEMPKLSEAESSELFSRPRRMSRRRTRSMPNLCKESEDSY